MIHSEYRFTSVLTKIPHKLQLSLLTSQYSCWPGGKVCVCGGGLHKYNLKLKQGSYWSERYLHLIQSIMWSVSPSMQYKTPNGLPSYHHRKGPQSSAYWFCYQPSKTETILRNQTWEKNNMEVWPVRSPGDPKDISRSQGNRSCRTCSSAPGRWR